MGILTGLLNVLLVLSSIFLIFLIMIQRGKGGGLAGAFGGVGGSSAFGTKAGDVFTKITIYTALVWFVLNMLLVFQMNQRRVSAFADPNKSKSSGKKVPGAPKAADKGGAATKELDIPPLKGLDTAPANKGTAPEPAPATGTTAPEPAGKGTLPPALPDSPEELPKDPFAEPKTP